MVKKLKGKANKWLSVFLTLCMVLTMMPTMVFAGNADSVDYTERYSNMELTFSQQPSYTLYDLELTTEVNVFVDGKRDYFVDLNQPVLIDWYVSKIKGELGTKYYQDAVKVEAIDDSASNNQKIEFHMPSFLFVTHTWDDPDGTYYITCKVRSTNVDIPDATDTSEQIEIEFIDPDTIRAGRLYPTLAQDGSTATIEASLTPDADGWLAYDWFYNTVDSNEFISGMTAIPIANGGQEATCFPSAALASEPNGVYYIFCRLINLSHTRPDYVEFTKTVMYEHTSGVGGSTNEVPVFENPANTITAAPNKVPSIPFYGNATVNDGGTITYQWYSCPFGISSASGGTALSGETGATFTPSARSSGGSADYYYVIATSTKGDQVQRKVQGGYKFEVSADIPRFIYGASRLTAYTGYAPYSYFDGTATADSGTITYQWYTTDNNSKPINGTAIEGATSAQYIPAARTESGTYYYYVVATNTKDGNTSSATRSGYEFESYGDAEKPNFRWAPAGTYTTIGNRADTKFKGQATVGDGGTLSYQWYSVATSGATTGGTLIEGATNVEYLPEAKSTAGEYYYYVVAKNQNADAIATNTLGGFVLEVDKAIHTITASAGANGTISPSGAVTVNSGDDKTFTFTPNSGYEVDTVTVDGTAIATASSYAFTNVAADHTINVTFKQISTPTLPSVEGDNQTMTVGADSDVTFKIDADFNDFMRLELNGATVDPANYTAVSGSIIITLKGDFVKTLGVGTYTFNVVLAGTTTSEIEVPMNLVVEAAPTVTTTYNVSYDDGVAGETITVPTDSNDYEAADKVTVSTTIPTRDGCTFKGWKDLSTATAPVTITDGKFDMPARDVVLVAQWEEVKEPTTTPPPTTGGTDGSTSTPDYNLNVIYGSGDGRYEAGTWITITAEKRDGKTFSHWISDEVTFENKNDSTTRLIMNSKDVTVTAVYKGEHANPQTGVPQTSDHNNMMFYFILAIISLGGVVFCKKLKTSK